MTPDQQQLLHTTYHHFFALSPDAQRLQLERFKGICALYGYEGFLRLQNAHLVLLGTGGVGSWVAECAARTGVGTISLVDFDTIELSNTNRQLHTLNSTLGQSKAETLAKRLRDINPFIHVTPYTVQLTKDNAAQLLAQFIGSTEEALLHAQESDLHAIPAPEDLAQGKREVLYSKLTAALQGAPVSVLQGAPVSVLQGAPVSALQGVNASAAPDTAPSSSTTKAHSYQQPAGIAPNIYAVDAIDDLWAKATCVNLLHRAHIPVVTSGGAGGRIDPTQVHLGDVATATGDQLMKRLRTELRRNYGYPKGEETMASHLQKKQVPDHKLRFNILCSYSTEEPQHAPQANATGLTPAQWGESEAPALPSFGAAMCVTATAGLHLASVIIRWIVG